MKIPLERDENVSPTDSTIFGFWKVSLFLDDCLAKYQKLETKYFCILLRLLVIKF